MGLAALGCNDATEGFVGFRADLSGSNEVPAVSTGAAGTCGFQLEGGQVRYSVEAHGITAVIGAHIHVAPAGTNGPVRVVLFPFPGGPVITTSPTGAVSGVLMTGTFDATHLSGITFEGLVSAMRSGQTYCNIHTTAHPGGEVRGQIQEISLD
jgi:hypothetical protein